VLLTTEHLRLAAGHLDAAVTRLRAHGRAGVNYEVGSLAEQLPEIHGWLAGLRQDPEWARGFHRSYPEFVLVVAEALRQTEPDTSGVDRTEDGWHVAQVIVCFNRDGGLGAGGDIVADLFVQDQHSYDLGGELRVRVPILDWLADGTILDNDLTADERLAAVLPEDYVSRDDDGDVEVDTWRLLTDTAAGHSPPLLNRS
jgi:hypothetical protein